MKDLLCRIEELGDLCGVVEIELLDGGLSACEAGSNCVPVCTLEGFEDLSA